MTYELTWFLSYAIRQADCIFLVKNLVKVVVINLMNISDFTKVPKKAYEDMPVKFLVPRTPLF